MKIAEGLKRLREGDLKFLPVKSEVTGRADTRCYVNS
jgi:hypothetical protein